MHSEHTPSLLRHHQELLMRRANCPDNDVIATFDKVELEEELV